MLLWAESGWVWRQRPAEVSCTPPATWAVPTLCRPGLRVAVCERAELRPRGAVVSIPPNGVRALEAIRCRPWGSRATASPAFLPLGRRQQLCACPGLARHLLVGVAKGWDPGQSNVARGAFSSQHLPPFPPPLPRIGLSPELKAAMKQHNNIHLSTRSFSPAGELVSSSEDGGLAAKLGVPGKAARSVAHWKRMPAAFPSSLWRPTLQPAAWRPPCRRAPAGLLACAAGGAGGGAAARCAAHAPPVPALPGGRGRRGRRV